MPKPRTSISKRDRELRQRKREQMKREKAELKRQRREKRKNTGIAGAPDVGPATEAEARSKDQDAPSPIRNNSESYAHDGIDRLAE